MSLNDYIFQKPIMQTKRLILRPLVESDEASLREWLADKSIYKYWGKVPVKQIKIHRSYSRKRPVRQKAFIWVLSIGMRIRLSARYGCI